MVKKSWAEQNVEIVETFFKNNFPQFELVNKKMYGPYWSLLFLEKDMKIHIGGDIGFSISIYIDDTEYALWQFDRNVNDASETNDINILLQLNILKRFLEDDTTNK